MYFDAEAHHGVDAEVYRQDRLEQPLELIQMDCK